MHSADAKELRKRLAAAGFEIFRVLGNRVHLADRVRDNLILDAAVAAIANPLGVRIVVRAPKSAFGDAGAGELFDRARSMAKDAVSRGYLETETAVVPVPDPGGSGATLETWYEVAFEKPVGGEQALFDELRFALGLEKAAGAG
jgi:sugar phosphate isomerase/epimerase